MEELQELDLTQVALVICLRFAWFSYLQQTTKTLFLPLAPGNMVVKRFYFQLEGYHLKFSSIQILSTIELLKKNFKSHGAFILGLSRASFIFCF